MTAGRCVAVIVAVAVLSACGDDGGRAVGDEAVGDEVVIDPGDGGDYEVEVDPAEFSSVVDHPYLPLTPGTVWVYEEEADGEIETTTVEVLDERRQVMGVETIVVRDVVTDADGDVVEDTADWFAQDANGNVWYFGEATTAYDGDTVSSEGSWEAGVDGALPGVVMPADLEVSGVGYRQEYLPGHAEDMGEIVAVGGSVSTPAGDFTDVVRTRDWTPLEPDVVEEKSYAPGVGLVHEVTTAGADAGAEVVLVAFTPA